MGDEYWTAHGRERAGTSRHASQYGMLQPQFRQPDKQVARHEQFRSIQYDTRLHDAIEDDEAYEQATPFDSFDEALLQQPYDDRQRQAVQGRARLSLAPAPSQFFNGAAPTRFDPQSAHYAQHVEADNEGDCYDQTEHGVRGLLDQFAYQSSQAHPHEYSSDVQFGPSSSPAFKAGVRKAGHNTDHSSQHVSKLPMYVEEHARKLQKQVLAYTHPRTTRVESISDANKDLIAVAQHKRSVSRPYQSLMSTTPRTEATQSSFAAPTIQGIRLVPVATLADRFRPMFPYPTFNAIQSKCFEKVFRTDDNFVLSSPTGSGKTVILELAVCRAVATNATDQYKVVYQAPTKALCSERQRDWEKKFTQIGLKCAELTGDSDAADLRNVQSANIIITTPEKWDSMTRKWKDHEKLMRLIKLFLIDEVHILKEHRGAVLEAVVSRMKSISTNVRFVALSATVPNFHDVAAWLGKNTSQPNVPAANEKFGEEFRPVKLTKHVCGYVSNSSNEFAFEKILDAKLTEVIAKFCERKPMMIFCATRNATVTIAQLIANWWVSRPEPNRLWNPPSKVPALLNNDLRSTMVAGVAFHHAGLELSDRMQVEKGFLEGEISVICCTSTLAVGVNLPCHLVIIKNTVAFTAEGLQEYSDLEMMQMLGRAGRPQFDDSAVAVIMTRQSKVRHYEMMITGQEPLESKLHLNLIDHMNAEIGLGTIRDLLSARKWLKGTFLYVRLQQNPQYYKLEGARSGQDVEEQVDDICFRDITLLRDNNLIAGQEYFQCTEFGHAMARYYVHFETMTVFIGLEPKASPSEILSAIAQASEYSKLRFRQGEKALYKLINKSPSIRWAIPVNLDLPAQKVSLLIQSVLGSADISWEGEMGKHKTQYFTEVQIVFKNINSLIRCIIDCQIYLGDSVSIHSALMLERSLGARAWDDSPLQMKQIEGVGVVAVRKFVNAGIRCMDDLEACEPHRIETLVGRNPPFGLKILEKVRQFPKLRVSLQAQLSSVVKTSEGAKIQVKADIGFINERAPIRFNNQLVYVCLLAETSDGRKVHFARISGPKLGGSQSLVFPALLTSPDQSINCYVMCDSIAGSMRGATVKPQIAPSMFPIAKAPDTDTLQQPNTSRRRIESGQIGRKPSTVSDDFGDDGINDDELVKVSFGDLDFDHIENYPDPTNPITQKNTAKNKTAKDNKDKSNLNNKSYMNRTDGTTKDDDGESVQLPSGKWACNHPCKDKTACKHLCCKTGMDRPPKKKSTTKQIASGEHQTQSQPVNSSHQGKATQTKLQLTASKRKTSAPIEELDLTQPEKKKKADYAKYGPKDYRDLHQLHKTIQGKDLPSSLHNVMHKKPAYCYSQGGDHVLSFLDEPDVQRPLASSEYGDIQFDELSSHFDHSQHPAIQQDLMLMDESPRLHATNDHQSAVSVASLASETFDDEDSLLGDAMIGLADSQQLQATSDQNFDAAQVSGEVAELGISFDRPENDYEMVSDIASYDANDYDAAEGQSATPEYLSLRPSRPAFKPDLGSNYTSKARKGDFGSAKATIKRPEVKPSKQVTATAKPSSVEASLVRRGDGRAVHDDYDSEPSEGTMVKDNIIPDAFKDLEPWLFQEFGDIVELVDG